MMLFDKTVLAKTNLLKLFDRHGTDLIHALDEHMREVFAPEARKTLRTFSTQETALFLGIDEAYLRQVTTDYLDGEHPEREGGRKREYTLQDINRIRSHLDEKNKSERHVRDRLHVPHRRPDQNEHLQVITTVNFKGGSAKTTTAVHLAQFLAFRGYRVLAVDLDPQASLTTLFGSVSLANVGEHQSMLGAINYEQPVSLASIIRPTNIDNLHLVPANLELAEFEHQTSLSLTRGNLPPSEAFYWRIKRALASVEDNYDIVIMDCPPQLGFLAMSALAAATGVLITIHPEMIDVHSMAQFLSMTSAFMKSIEKYNVSMDYDFIKYLFTRYEPNDNPQSQMRDFLATLFDGHVLNNPVLKSTAISDAGVLQQSLYELDRSHFTRGTYDRAIACLNDVHFEIETIISQVWGRKP